MALVSRICCGGKQRAANKWQPNKVAANKVHPTKCTQQVGPNKVAANKVQPNKVEPTKWQPTNQMCGCLAQLVLGAKVAYPAKQVYRAHPSGSFHNEHGAASSSAHEMALSLDDELQVL